MKYLVIVSTLFVIGSLFGYGLELLFRRFVSQKRWVNPGFLVGPYIPLYGFGVVILYCLSNIPVSADIDSLFLTYIVKILVIGISLTLIEYITGLIFIKGMHIKLWDYSNRWGNIQGIICPLFSLFWFVAGSLYFFFINPILVDAISWISENLIYTYFIGMVVGMMCVDAAYSIHLGFKLKKASANFTIKFEQFKVEAKERSKIKFFGSIVNLDKTNKTLSELIKNHVNSLPKPHKWWEKEKDE